MNAISVIRTGERELRLEWLANASNDMIADSTLALICGIDSNFATVKRKYKRGVTGTAAFSQTRRLQSHQSITTTSSIASRKPRRRHD